MSEVAARLGVARSTVYAHWRDWGGYKLGSGAKAPIRFEASRLPGHVRTGHDDPAPRPTQRRRTGKRTLIIDAPRMPNPVEDAA